MNSNFENELPEYNFEEHWNKAYQKTPTTNLGWYEENPTSSLELIEACDLSNDAVIFNAGAGATSLIKLLLEKGYKNIIINDIAATALAVLKNDLTIDKASNVQFIVDDLTKPTALLKLKDIDIWHDRAVLHFFTEKQQRNAYFQLLKKVIKLNYLIYIKTQYK
jgi:hypothetical protein